MKRVSIALVFLSLSSLSVHAACSGSGTVWSCAAGSTSAQIQAAINSAPDGAVITFAPGSYTVTNGGINFSNSKGATLICATPPKTVGAATDNGCLIHSNDHNAIGGKETFGGTNKYFYRVSGFIFDGADLGPGNGGVIWFDNYNGTSPLTMYGPNGLGGIRVDHNTFQNFYTRAEVIYFGHVYGGAAIINVTGVVDHNLFQGPEQNAALFGIGLPNPIPQPSNLGTVANVFFEDNTINFTNMSNASNAGCTDGWGGVSFVVRHNAATNCMWMMHGATHNGGPVNYEFYNNSTTLNINATGGEQIPGDPTSINCDRCFHHQGSGTFMAFNNTFSIPAGNKITKAPMVMQDYRASAKGPSIDGNMAACDGTVVNVANSYITFSDGNRTPAGNNYGYPCRFQPGRDSQGNYKPMYVWNNYWPNNGNAQALLATGGNGGIIPNGSFPPTNCDPTPVSGTCDYFPFHMKNDREWFNAVSASPNTDSATPFNGTTGMGFGPMANRPTTCSTSSESAYGKGAAGVGYFATDQGPQGTLYTCSATNTWAVYYAPYTYPHPLVTGNPSGAPASPKNLTAVVK